MNAGSNNSKSLYERLREEIGKLWVVDVHEHLPSEEEWKAQKLDLVSILGYLFRDLISAGMPKDLLRSCKDMEEAWKNVKPYWKYVQHMGHGTLFRKMVSLFFNIDDVEALSIPTLAAELEKIQISRTYRDLLDEYGVIVSLNVVKKVTKTSSNSHFAPLLNTSDFAMVQSRDDLEKIEEASNKDISSLKTYLEALDTIIEEAYQNGMVGFKWHKLAYLREINYAPQTTGAAERCFERILKLPARDGVASDTAVGFEEMHQFQDFIQHFIVRRSIDLDLPIQIHTGIQGSTSGAQINYANPCHLVEIFLQYPRARFDLLHASYPYMAELAALSKLFPNVYINTAWFDLLSPEVARRCIGEWITSVPLNKIFTFGGDQHNILLACACSEIARNLITKVMADKVAQQALSEQQALESTLLFLRDNAWNYFRLEERWKCSHGVNGQKKPRPRKGR